MNEAPGGLEMKSSFLAIAGIKRHLHVVCSKRFFNPRTGVESIVAVNVSSVKQDKPYDPTCILRKGDHEFIKHDSYVYYRGAVIMRIPSLLQKIEAGEVTVLTAFADDVFERIMDGFRKSPLTPPKILNLLNEAELNSQ